MKKLAKTLSSLERKVLPHIQNNMTIKKLVSNTSISEVEVTRSLQFLQNKEIVKLEKTTKKIITLGKTGKEYNELPERGFIKTISKQPKTLQEIEKESKLNKQEVNACLGLLKSKAAINFQKGKVTLTTQGEKLLDKPTHEEQLFKKIKANSLEESSLTDIEKFAYNNLKKRKELIQLEEIKTTTITLTKKGNELKKEKLNLNLIESITPSLLKTGKWKNQEFREYDIKINVPSITKGRRHPYNETMNILRNSFLEMGFKEMEGPWVETAFWNMDSMWIPQDHPAREVQDTFYLDKKGKLPTATLVAKVKAAHENGLKTGSTGHTKVWDPNVAKQLLLRTHSTATTYRYFHELKLNHDCKYFYIADNFRNEAIDATHLPEFGQAEGFIMGDNLTLADLMGFIREFYKKLGITKIRFKPTYNPYTEPSMEAHYFNEKLGKWYALINSGIFRPESLAPYGITKSVIAWGMGSSRIVGVLTGKKKLKELFGPEVDFNWIKKHKRVKV